MADPAVGAASPSPAQRRGAEAVARAFIEQLTIGRPATDHAVAPRPRVTPVEGSNGSGYADTGSGFTQVSGDWIEPSASCTSTTALAAFWIGLDGYTSDWAEKAGTLMGC